MHRFSTLAKKLQRRGKKLEDPNWQLGEPLTGKDLRYETKDELKVGQMPDR